MKPSGLGDIFRDFINYKFNLLDSCRVFQIISFNFIDFICYLYYFLPYNHFGITVPLFSKSLRSEIYYQLDASPLL